MGAGDRPRAGMTPLDVCCVMRGWRFHRVYPSCDFIRFHTWDFISPDETEILRVTFDRQELLVWGEPALEELVAHR
ncbi:MAG TPA: hypothetical protein VGI81_01130 [Tepidisphaeraceae bacterium]